MEQCLCSLTPTIGVFPVFLFLFTTYQSGKAIWNNREWLGSAAIKVFFLPEATYQAVKFHTSRCLIPRFDGAICFLEWKEALWDKYVTAAPRPRTQSEQQYSDRKLQPRR